MDSTFKDSVPTTEDATVQNVPASISTETEGLSVSAVEYGDGYRLQWTVEGDENLSKFYTQVSNDNEFHTFLSAKQYFEVVREKPPNEMRLKDTTDRLTQAFLLFCLHSYYIPNIDDELKKARSGKFRTSYNYKVLRDTGLSDSKGGPVTAAQDLQ